MLIVTKAEARELSKKYPPLCIARTKHRAFIEETAIAKKEINSLRQKQIERMKKG